MAIDKNFYCPSKEYLKKVIQNFSDTIFAGITGVGFELKKDGGYQFFIDVSLVRNKFVKELIENPLNNLNHKELINLISDYVKLDILEFTYKYKLYYIEYRKSILNIDEIICMFCLSLFKENPDNEYDYYWNENKKFKICKYCYAHAHKIKKISHKKTCANKLEIILNIPINESSFRVHAIRSLKAPFEDRSLEYCFKKIKKYFEKYNKVYGLDL